MSMSLNAIYEFYLGFLHPDLSLAPKHLGFFNDDVFFQYMSPVLFTINTFKKRNGSQGKAPH